ncbi:MAG: ferritin family protein, partial [Deltaproteobacteria bacterium]|nr:ferritin family protein [Deltaproteobacteria bacterium]
STGEILDLAVRIEQNGEAVYRDAIAMLSDPELISLLNWMADEEAKHAQWFIGLKDQLEARAANPFVKEMSRELFNELLGEKSFSHKEVDFSTVADVDELMAIFIEFEKDTILFYEMLEPFIEDERTRADLRSIIAEENNHISRLQDMMGSEMSLSVNRET